MIAQYDDTTDAALHGFDTVESAIAAIANGETDDVTALVLTIPA